MLATDRMRKDWWCLILRFCAPASLENCCRGTQLSVEARLKPLEGAHAAAAVLERTAYLCRQNGGGQRQLDWAAAYSLQLTKGPCSGLACPKGPSATTGACSAAPVGVSGSPKLPLTAHLPGSFSAHFGPFPPFCISWALSLAAHTSHEFLFPVAQGRLSAWGHREPTQLPHGCGQQPCQVVTTHGDSRR